MAWDSTGRYYYRSERSGGQPRRVYVGGGRLGELAAQMDALERAQRAELDAQRREERAAALALDAAIDADYGRLRTWTAALLLASGWYQHKREWRRMGKKLLGQAGDSDGARRAADAVGEWEALVKRLNGPKPRAEDLDMLRAVLADGGPDGRHVTALGSSVILGDVLDGCTSQTAARLVLRADADRMRRTLGGDNASRFERPLIDHIVTCWVRMQLAERDLTRVTAGQHNMKEATYRDRRLSEAQRRYLRALHLLAKLRSMGPLQVNIANQQVVMNGGNGRD